ncbi:MAG TPA: phosphoribosyltransferase family protein [Gemmatimonadaceae bacterium]|nr:phosphoribosyltransferase family protein [Gemmatimonadaceae bacterium]
MTQSPGVLDIVSAREGHFRLESGYHSSLWLDLDSLFADPVRIAPLARNLARGIEPFEPSVVCGPLVGGAFLAQLVAKTLGVDFCYSEKLHGAETAGLYRTRYTVPAAFHGRIRHKKVALVDDVMSAGSSLRATFAALKELHTIPVVAGALLVLGSTGEGVFRGLSVPVVAGERREYQTWEPAHCPHCAAGIPLEVTG